MPSPRFGPARLFRTADPEGTKAVGRALARAALPLPPGGLVVCLSGELGAGKTVFVKGIAEGLGLPSSAAVVSPTFTIARSYTAGEGVTLHHVDAYRLSSGADLERTGFEDLCGEGCLTCVEWSERVQDALPAEGLHVVLEVVADVQEAAPGGPLYLPRRIRVGARGRAAAVVLERMGREAECG